MNYYGPSRTLNLIGYREHLFEKILLIRFFKAVIVLDLVEQQIVCDAIVGAV